MSKQPIDSTKLKQAIELATYLHFGQIDKAGKEYIEHCLRVMNAVEGETEKIVAVLHDTLEDTSITFEELEKMFGSAVAQPVKVLTRSKKEDYFDFINRIKQDPIATKIKIADLKDNSNLARLDAISDRDIKRNEKYQKALEVLEASDRT